jgi:GH25 family lysozyme M1 (1,4-beta-N-acetylmuramidase)
LSQIYGIDAASFQGNVDWSTVDQLCDFGAEKVTEGAAYANPFWPAAKSRLLARAKQTGFVPMAYLFLDANTSGSAQADWFARHAGDLTGFAVVIDVERSPSGSPTRLQTSRCAARLRKHYPGHPVGGYAPRWFTAGWNLKFFDWVWGSSYVTGSGDPIELAKGIPASWWDAYGSMKPEVLQYTSSGQVPGVDGLVDCSLYRGSRAELAKLVLPAAKPTPIPVPPVSPAPPPAPPAQTAPVPVIPAKHELAKNIGHAVTVLQLPAGSPTVHLPVWLPLPASVPEPYEYFALQLAGDAGAQVKVVLRMSDGTLIPKVKTMEAGKVAEVMPEQGWAVFEVAELSRLDANPALSVTVRTVTW